MKIKQFMLVLLIIAVVSIFSAHVVLVTAGRSNLQTASASINKVDPSIVASGEIRSQNEATLHFQTSGKLVSLPIKEGDTVSTGQLIAQLDTYTVQRQLTQALNAYRTTRDAFDQSKTNQDSGLLQNTSQQTMQNGSQTEFTQPKVLGGDASYNYLNDVAKRIVDQNQANLDNSVINVELANYAIQLSTLTSPINGILTHEDVTVSNLNVSPTTSFMVADPNSLVFKANIPASQIEYVSEGANAVIHLDGLQQDIHGVVSKIYPERQTLPTGDVYEVDVQSDGLKGQAKLSQSGSVVIMTNTDENVTLVPTWAVLSHNYLWVLEDTKPVLKKVTVGSSHNGQTEVTGLNVSEKVILDPAGIADKKYSLL